MIPASLASFMFASDFRLYLPKSKSTSAIFTTRPRGESVVCSTLFSCCNNCARMAAVVARARSASSSAARVLALRRERTCILSKLDSLPRVCQDLALVGLRSQRVLRHLETAASFAENLGRVLLRTLRPRNFHRIPRFVRVERYVLQIKGQRKRIPEFCVLTALHQLVAVIGINLALGVFGGVVY